MMTKESATTMDRKEFFKLVGISVGAIVLQQCLSGCNTGGTDDPKPTDETPTENFSINVNDTNFTALRTAGGFVRYKGIIVARTLQGAVIAVSQACTHEGTAVTFVSSNTTFVCPAHGSVFTERGAVQTGPATKPLKAYKTSFDVSTGAIEVIV
ncbi:QcrA and Rieske domain-containing protein [Runella slithyformis]|uniref:Rieske (2Fe-2S) iron-sulfur domain protein n=1 Tax=Runella slithyformis (strain ATCC 29530 / DSM 19594 / LMG 11500 / NCIMB 11436 / LSU 4) TaxID=761193 RepID=A0A7U4E4V0_RUNSL|nr:Rieske 2Fe-2S domain-containing protein [Runella slithyformis]AEI47444.1 Rieske (2Fe-2S) iron-sulfur domain protein [Runella slithyformis DSM 19594]